MRSTATFEPDVSSRLQKLIARRQQSKKAVLNEVMRRGLDALEQSGFEVVPFEPAVHRGTGPLDPRRPSEILAEMEAEAFLEKHARAMTDWEAAQKT